MHDDVLWLRKAVVAASAAIYWASVLFQTRRVQKLIGRPPNVTPRSPKEKALWAAWFSVVAGWVGQPFLIQLQSASLGSFIPCLMHPATVFLGVAMVIGGYACTLWCWAIMGEHWRMGVNKQEKTSLVRRGPYQWVRHPIYSFQIIILVGVFFLLPTLFSAILLGTHLLCVVIKALDEESHLIQACGPDYAVYVSTTGRFFPKPSSLWRA